MQNEILKVNVTFGFNMIKVEYIIYGMSIKLFIPKNIILDERLANCLKVGLLT